MTIFLASNIGGYDERIALFGKTPKESDFAHPMLSKVKNSIMPIDNLELPAFTNASGDILPFSLYEELISSSSSGYPWRLFDDGGEKICEKFPTMGIRYFKHFNKDNQWAQAAIDKALEVSDKNMR